MEWGGKLEGSETVEEAMVRETEEEISVIPTKYDKVADVEFLEFYKDNKENIRIHIYVATDWTGEPKESEEMNPKWFNIEDIPYDNMFEDDKYWLPLVLDGKKVKAFFEFDEDWNLKNYTIEEVKQF